MHKRKRPFRGPTHLERPPRSDGGKIYKRARPVAWAACVAAVAFVAAVLSAVPAQAVTGYHVVVGSLGVNARSGPGTSYPAVGKLYNGQAIDIACQTKGSLVGVGLPGTPTDVWDKLANGWYITDYYTSTTGMNGSYTPGIPQCGAATPPTTPSPAPPVTHQPLDGCAQVRVVGVRGSGEALFQTDASGRLTNILANKGLGPEVENFYDTVDHALHNGIAVDVRSHEIRYDAVGVLQDGLQGYGSTYYNSVQLGKNYLTSYLVDHLNNCQNEHLVLAGYSQGADVVHQVWNTFVSGDGINRWRGRLDGLVLFADPRFSGYQVDSIVNRTPELSLDQGTFSWFMDGLLTGGIGYAFGNGPVIWSPQQEQFHFMKSYCDANDAVCQWWGTKAKDPAAIAVHTGYKTRGVTAQAGNSISDWLRAHYFH